MRVQREVFTYENGIVDCVDTGRAVVHNVLLLLSADLRMGLKRSVRAILAERHYASSIWPYLQVLTPRRRTPTRPPRIVQRGIPMSIAITTTRIGKLNSGSD